MKKLALLTALSVIALSSFANAEETPTVKSVADKMIAKTDAKSAVTGVKTDAKTVADKMIAKTDAKIATKADMKTPAKKMANQAPKGFGSRSLARFNKIDTDKNGKISQAEFTSSQLVAFKKKDKNKDDVLQQSEFSPTLAKAAQMSKN